MVISNRRDSGGSMWYFLLQTSKSLLLAAPHQADSQNIHSSATNGKVNGRSP
jgi:hypothetical protein